MTTTPRTDIHRPSAPEFDPQKYDMLGLYDLQMPEYMIVAHADPFGGVKYEQVKTPDHLLWWKQTPRLAARGITEAPHTHGHTCGHCGAHLRYAAIMYRTDVAEWIFVGQDCLDGRFAGTKADFDAMRKDAQEQAELTRKGDAQANRVAKLVTDHPVLAILTDPDELAKLNNRFLNDLASQLHHRDLSENQVNAAVRSIEKSRQWAAQREAERTTAQPAPTGRVVVTGTILSAKWHHSAYGASYKITVKDDRGFVVWGTAPEYRDVDKGMRIQFTATLQPKDDDPFFAFYKRPTKCQVDGVPGEVVPPAPTQELTSAVA